MTAADAVKAGTIDNETLAYFMVRTQQFLLAAGVTPGKLRFRQHRAKEMAHYAKHCWDCELKMTYDWVECVGIADRSAFDLTAHSAASGVDLSAHVSYDAPIEKDVVTAELNRAKIGKLYRKDGQILVNHLEGLDIADAQALQAQLNSSGSAKLSLKDPVDQKVKEFVVEKDMVKLTVSRQKVTGARFIPSVIEPSYGIGRIMYAIFEHTYRQRYKAGSTTEVDEKRAYLALPAVVAPVKVALLPMSSDAKFDAIVATLQQDFVQHSLSCRMDDSGTSPGRKYARADEIGVPYSVTIDFESINDQCVTIRERDSMTQIRVSIGECARIIYRLVQGALTWDQAYSTYPRFAASSSE